MGLDHPVAVETFPDGARRIIAAVYWRHRLGGEAHCLGRVFFSPGGRVPVVELSALRTSPFEYQLGSDYSSAASRLIDILAEIGEVIPDDAVWIEHYGRFSSYGFPDDEGYILIPLHRGVDGVSDDIREHRELPPQEAIEILEGLPTSTVEEDVVKVGLEGIKYW